jgi:serine/threonine-protein kinase
MVSDSSEASVTDLPREGDVLAGRYRVERVIGHGGLGVVICARHTELDERVAIKLLRPEVTQNADAVGRFKREARAAVRIKSEHVARVMDVGALPGGAPYMVMEYLEGQDLKEVLAAQGPLPIADVAEYVLQACEAVAEAHALGIVHRDLKPSNLFLIRRTDGSPCIKVLDFGIARGGPGSMDDGVMTQGSVVVGSPIYMSPEQMAAARDQDARADIWALGVILYELLTGSPPFHGDTIAQLCTMILQGTPTPVRELRPDVPAKMEAVVRRCLEKLPIDRYTDVGELAWDVSDFAPARSALIAERVERVVGSVGAGDAPLRGRRRGRQRQVLFGAIAVTSFGIAAAVLWLRSGDPELTPGQSEASAAAERAAATAPRVQAEVSAGATAGATAAQERREPERLEPEAGLLLPVAPAPRGSSSPSASAASPPRPAERPGSVSSKPAAPAKPPPSVSGGLFNSRK